MNKITISYVTNLGHNHVFSDVLSGSNPTQKAWYLRQVFINHISTRNFVNKITPIDHLP